MCGWMRRTCGWETFRWGSIISTASMTKSTVFWAWSLRKKKAQTSLAANPGKNHHLIRDLERLATTGIPPAEKRSTNSMDSRGREKMAAEPRAGTSIVIASRRSLITSLANPTLPEVRIISYLQGSSKTKRIEQKRKLDSHFPHHPLAINCRPLLNLGKEKKEQSIITRKLLLRKKGGKRRSWAVKLTRF